MKNIALILFLSIFVFAISCNDDHDCPVVEPEPEPTEEPKIIELNEPFIAKIGEKWHYENDGDTFDIQIVGIFDGRAYGDGCVLSTGGSAEISIMKYFGNFRDGIKFTWQGCDGLNEYDINNPNLPNVQFDTRDYYLKMMKMYPLSEYLENVPTDLSIYEIKLVLLK